MVLATDSPKAGRVVFSFMVVIELLKILMSNSTSNPQKAVSPAEIVECVRSCLKANGLDSTRSNFDGMERLLSRLPFWAEVKQATDNLFAEERKREEDLVLARARAAAPTIVQMMPGAQAGVLNSIQFNDTVGQFIEHVDNINKQHSLD